MNEKCYKLGFFNYTSSSEPLLTSSDFEIKMEPKTRFTPTLVILIVFFELSFRGINFLFGCIFIFISLHRMKWVEAHKSLPN